MRPDAPVKDLTEAQKTQADIAGVPANRPGLGAEYPKMVYRPGDNPRHMHLSEPLLVGNGAYDPRSERLGAGVSCMTAFVDSFEDEVEALADGWFLSPDPAEQAKQMEKYQADIAKDQRIAELEAQLSERRGLGRPSKPIDGATTM